MSAAIRPTVVPSPWARLCTVIGAVICRVIGTVLCGVFRTALRAVLCVVRAAVAVACLVPPAATADETVPAPVREIGSRRELFVDDWLIDRLRNVALRMHRPQPRELAIVCDAPWEGNTSAYFTLFADGDRFRMYYRGAHFDEQAKQPTHPEFTCLAESRDGIRWEKPRLGLFEFAGSKENNIVWAGAETHNFTPFKDTNPACPADARYKALGGGHVRWGGKGLRAYTSPDGIRWSLLREEAIIADGDFDSQNLAFWDPLRQCYVAFFRKGRDGIRDIMTSTSTDFRTWTEPVFLDYGTAPREHLYTNAIGPYSRAPHLLLGFPTRFQPANEQVEPILMTSRDGRRFHRWPEPLIPITAPEDRGGNRSNYMTSGLLRLPAEDRELSVYATEAYYAGAGSRVRRFTFRTDGFVSASAGAEGGELLTRPLRFTGREFEINYRTAPTGGVRVELQSADGTPLPGFTAADCTVIVGDEVSRMVTWGDVADVGPFAGRPVRLRIVLDDADLFAIRFR